ncbi:RNA-directed DNA polymerase, eukaryota, reverse transcriptase zinc-binding domain protein [Tanacetum coccineum]
MNSIDDDQGIGVLHPILFVRRSARLHNQMAKHDGGSDELIDLTGGQADVVSGFGEEGVVKKISQKCKKAVVGEETGGVKKSADDGLVDHNKKCKKTVVGEEKQVHKKNGKKDVGCKAPDVDRLLDNFNEETCVLNVNGKAIPVTKETIKDVLGVPMGSVYVQARDEADCRHRLVIEWKSQFGKKDSHNWTVDMLNKIEAERFSTNNVEEVKKSVAAKLKKAGELIDEAEYELDEALEQNPDDTELIQLSDLRDVLFGSRTYSQPAKDSPKTNKDQINEQVSALEYRTILKYRLMIPLFPVIALPVCRQRFVWILFGEMRPLQGVTGFKFRHDLVRAVRIGFASKKGCGAACCSLPHLIVSCFDLMLYANGFFPFPFTQFYGTPSAYIAYSEEVELERSNKEKRLRSDNVNVAKFDLSLTQLADTTRGGNADVSHLTGFQTPETVQGVRVVADVSGNPKNIRNKAVTRFNVCDTKPLQSIPQKAELRSTKRNIRLAEVLRYPYVVREVSVCGAVSNHEKRAADCLFSGRFNQTDILFKTDNVNGPRGVLETLCPGIMISSGVIDIFSKVLNHAELYCDSMKQMRGVFCETSMMKQCGDDVLGKKADMKRKLGLNNKKGKKVVVGDANVTEKGFGEEGVVKKISQKCKKSVVGEETGGVKKSGDDGFLHCINDETAIHKFDWCTFILECLVRTKKSWIRRSHYTGPVIILLEVKKSVAAKLKKAGELIDEAEYELDEALEQNPDDTEADILFKTDNVNGPRGVLETLCPGIMISSGVIDIFSKVLNHAELYCDPLKQIRRVFCETSMMFMLKGNLLKPLMRLCLLYSEFNSASFVCLFIEFDELLEKPLFLNLAPKLEIVNLNRRSSSKRKVKLPAKFNNHVVNQSKQKRANNVEKESNEEIRVSKTVDCGSESVFGDRLKDVDETELGVFGNSNDYNNSKHKPNVSIPVNNVAINEDSVSVHTVDSCDENDDVEEIANISANTETVQCKNDCDLDNTIKLTLRKLVVNKMDGIEIGIFDEEIVEEGRKKWELIACGYFVGYKMYIQELNYHLFRMWGKYGLRKIISIGNGNYVFNFNNESGLQTVIENGVWIVNNKPMVVQKWDIDVDINKVEPDKLPIWVKLVNLPLKAWTVKGLSALASRLGRLVMMDYVTTKMCNQGIGRLGFARVLIEVEAQKGLPEAIDIQYYDKDDKMTISKTVKVLYDWKPPLCDTCKVFGHSKGICGQNKEQEGVKGKSKQEQID